ncbi:MAG: type I glutamate--ammonia ligase [Candidatus Dadabacteria bacterium]|nr:MAG: type I glutamate--ammonia ligase [Candidatus Dadabacteria bacterium]
MTKTPKDVIEFAQANGCEFVDYKFCDLFGQWQHFGMPISELSEDIFEEGLGFDGSSIRGWQTINASDMILIADPETAAIDPFIEAPTLSLICDVFDPITREPYSRDPRLILRKALNYMQGTGIADTAFFGPEPEFFIFDDIRFNVEPQATFAMIDSEEAWWNNGADEMPNLGHKIKPKSGYFPVSPLDTLTDLRNEMALEMQRVGIIVEAVHHEVASSGQCEIDMRFQEALRMADQYLWFKYIIKNVAKRNGKTVTFMPKPLAGDNGSGMHVHQSLWKGGEPLFAGDGYAGMSELALHYIGGIKKHARALAAITNPTINSYKRLVPGFEAPVSIAHSSRNRSASIRIPMYSPSPKAKRIETRFPDPTCNGYLAFAALLMAGLDGIENKIDPGEPMDKDLYALSPEELKDIPQMPGSLEEALDALEADHEFLLKGDVFTPDVIEGWVAWKRENEIDRARLLPHPVEFELYYDI